MRTALTIFTLIGTAFFFIGFILLPWSPFNQAKGYEFLIPQAPAIMQWWNVVLWILVAAIIATTIAQLLNWQRPVISLSLIFLAIGATSLFGFYTVFANTNAAIAAFDTERSIQPGQGFLLSALGTLSLALSGLAHIYMEQPHELTPDDV